MPTLIDQNEVFAQLYGNATNSPGQTRNLGGLLQGYNFDPNAYRGSRPDLAANYAGDPGYEELYGSLDNYLRADWEGNGSPTRFNTGGISSLNSDASASASRDETAANSALRTANIDDLARLGPAAQAAWEAANPKLAQFTDGLLGNMNRLNATRGDVKNTMAQGGNAGISQAGISQAGYGQAQTMGGMASLADFTAANRGLLSGQLEGDASRLLAMDGRLTAGEQTTINENVLGTFGDRGLGLSAGSISSLALQSDAARQNRRMQNASYAQNVAGMNQGYNLADASGAQNNRQFNSGLLTDMSRFNASEGNQGNRFNVESMNQGNRFNADAMNQGNRFNAEAMNKGNQFNAEAMNKGNQFNAGLLQNANQFNASAANDMARFNAENARALDNDSWNRSMGYAGILNDQSRDINGMVKATSGAPGMGYNNVNQAIGLQTSNNDMVTSMANFNANAKNAESIAAANNEAAKAAAKTSAKGSIWGSALGAVGKVVGAAVY